MPRPMPPACAALKRRGSATKTGGVRPPAWEPDPRPLTYSSDLNFGAVQLPHTHGKVQSATLPLSSAR